MPRVTRRQRGFTILELMIALFIGLFLLGALLIVVQDNKRAFTTQNGLARLQDDERLAMTILGDSIQQNGYFPDPTINTAASTLPVKPLWPLLAQSLNGFAAGTYGIGESIAMRRAATAGDGSLDYCTGTPWTGATSDVGSLYYVSNGALYCNEGFLQPSRLVGDDTNFVTRNPVQVTNMTFLYGMNSAGTSTNVDTYKKASQMASTDWFNVISVQITLTFTNPLYNGPVQTTLPAYQYQGQYPTVTFSRVVDIMRLAGM